MLAEEGLEGLRDLVPWHLALGFLEPLEDLPEGGQLGLGDGRVVDGVSLYPSRRTRDGDRDRVTAGI